MRQRHGKENEFEVLVHLRKPRVPLRLRIMQLTCSTDSVIQFLERHPASTGEINCSWREGERAKPAAVGRRRNPSEYSEQ